MNGLIGTILCGSVFVATLFTGAYLINEEEQATYTIEEVDIIEIEYLAGGWGTSAKTIVRCQSETYVFSGTLSLPLGRVIIEYIQPIGGVYNLEKWRRYNE